MAKHRKVSRNNRRNSGNSPSPRLPGRKLFCEQLEDRRMLAVVTVNTDQDVVDFNDGVTSLREAIFATNTVSGADEIVFEFDHDGPATILLTQGELAITDDLTISGPGAELLTIDASGNDPTPDSTLDDGDPTNDGDGSRIFMVNDGDDFLHRDVTLHGMTLTGGDIRAALVSESGGGAVRSTENLIITDSILTKNQSSSGGAIFVTGGFDIQSNPIHLKVDNSELSYNQGASGGAINSIFSDVTIFDSTISNNSAKSYGGAISTIFRNLSVIDSIIDSNTAIKGGGGIEFLSRDELSITGSTLSNNQLLGSSSQGGGGGINSSGGTLTIENSTVSGNSTSKSKSNGGGINAYSRTSDGITITDSAIIGNTTHGGFSKGGGAFFGEGIVSIKNSLIDGNSTHGEHSDGGGIHGRQVTIDNSVISNNSTTGRSADGGGIAGGRTIAIVNSTVKGNSTTGDESDGGGVRIHSSNSHSILNSVIEDNTTPGRGGGLALYTNPRRPGIPFKILYPPGISGSTFSRNHAEGYGGGIAFFGTAATSFTNSTVTENRSDNHGGGIYFDTSNETRVISHSTITRNHSDEDESGTGSGGGVFIQAGSVEFDHTVIANNHDHTEVGHDVTGFIGTSSNYRYSFIGNNRGTGLAEAPIGSPDANGNLAGGPDFGSINPRLAPLADNGGPTPTHALLPGSPAIDAGDPNLNLGAEGLSLFDQRGAPFSRIYGGRIDIGAYESQPEDGSLTGDLDRDGDVDGADFLSWQRGYVPENKASITDSSEMVGTDELAAWQRMFGTTSGTSFETPVEGEVAAQDSSTLPSLAALDEAFRRRPDNEKPLIFDPDLHETAHAVPDPSKSSIFTKTTNSRPHDSPVTDESGDESVQDDYSLDALFNQLSFAPR